MNKKYTDEIINAIAADSAIGFTRKELSLKYGIPIGTVSTIITKANKKAKAEAEAKIRRCPHCGTALENPAMKYCWNCGQDVRSEEQLLLNDVKALLNILSAFPSSQAEDGIRIALKLEKYLKKAENGGKNNA